MAIKRRELCLASHDFTTKGMKTGFGIWDLGTDGRMTVPSWVKSGSPNPKSRIPNSVVFGGGIESLLKKGCSCPSDGRIIDVLEAEPA